MKVLITGGTGFIGSALRKRLSLEGHLITCTSRTRTGTEGTTRFVAPGSLKNLEPHDAVINLAGEGIVGFWTRSKRKAIYDSRILATREISEWIDKSEKKPAVFLSGSAVGIYGDAGSRVLTESTDVSTADGFLPRVCRDWEESAAVSGTRAVQLRTGQVLDPNGGFLGKALPLMRRFPIVIIGHRQAYLPWIALSDWIDLAMHALVDESIAGPLNLTAPVPATQEEFGRLFAKRLGKRVWGRIPRWALRLVAGEFGDSIGYSQRAIPEKAIQAGHVFNYHTLTEYLDRSSFGP